MLLLKYTQNNKAQGNEGNILPEVLLAHRARQAVLPHSQSSWITILKGGEGDSRERHLSLLAGRQIPTLWVEYSAWDSNPKKWYLTVFFQGHLPYLEDLFTTAVMWIEQWLYLKQTFVSLQAKKPKQECPSSCSVTLIINPGEARSSSR